MGRLPPRVIPREGAARSSRVHGSSVHATRHSMAITYKMGAGAGVAERQAKKKEKNKKARVSLRMANVEEIVQATGREEQWQRNRRTRKKAPFLSVRRLGLHVTASMALLFHSLLHRPLLHSTLSNGPCRHAGSFYSRAASRTRPPPRGPEHSFPNTHWSRSGI